MGLPRGACQIQKLSYIYFEAEVGFKWLPKCVDHCRKHQTESPEITPEFIECLMSSGEPSHYYPDREHPYRYIFEGYFPPGTGRPYRVVFEVTDEDEILPVACWRIRDREFIRTGQ